MATDMDQLRKMTIAILKHNNKEWKKDFAFFSKGFENLISETMRHHWVSRKNYH